MPLYTYRREDGTTFDIRQNFNDSPLTQDPITGQGVVRVVQGAGIIFKGSGFYVTDNRGGSRVTTPRKEGDATKSESDAKSDSPASTEKPAASAPAAPTAAAAD